MPKKNLNAIEEESEEDPSSNSDEDEDENSPQNHTSEAHGMQERNNGAEH